MSSEEIISKEIADYKHISLQGFKQIFLVIEFIEKSARDGKTKTKGRG